MLRRPTIYVHGLHEITAIYTPKIWRSFIKINIIIIIQLQFN